MEEHRLGAAGSPEPFAYMAGRIHKILLVCSSYDGYILEEDGRIESQINREYIELNMSNPPSITRVGTTAEALEAMRRDEGFDFILTMYNVGEPDVFRFARIAKHDYPRVPVILLTPFTRNIHRRLGDEDRSGIDYIFAWHGNADLIIAIIKLIEDEMNAEHDILQGGVQAILLVEDSIRYYSTYLPAIYKLILQQYSEFLKDALNEQQQVLRKRARPKILMATNFDDALELYERYKEHLLGVISDVGFVMHRGDRPDEERLDAGIELCRRVRSDNPLMPFLLQSSQDAFRDVARELGVGFIRKNSKTLLMQLAEYIADEFAFGDFLFRDPATRAILCRARDLRQMEECLATVPDEVLEYHASQNHLSKWMFARGLFRLGMSLRAMKGSHFPSTEEHRRVLLALLGDYRTLLGQGVVARFEPETYSDAIGFARLGEGSIGGKARGLAFINSMLQRYNLYNKYPGVRILIPRTIVVATDYFDRFIKENGLQYVIGSDVTDEELLSEFVSSRLPQDLVEELHVFIRTVRDPLAVRSSSKLEDSHYQPFAGIYSTYMIPPTENEDQSLRLLGKAIKSVYASVFFAGARAYIATSSNLLSEEKMAVIVQELCGTEQEGLFLPTLSGVARSVNHYPAGDERAEDGIALVAYGLGKIVVEGGRALRFSPAMPRKALQTSTPELALRDTQKEVFALNLRPEAFRTSVDDGVNLVQLDVAEAARRRSAQLVVSTWDAASNRIAEGTETTGPRLITFNRILKYDAFPLAAIVRDLLKVGSDEMHAPVEIEYAANLDTAPGERQIFNMLQIRPIVIDEEQTTVDWSRVDPSDTLIYAESALGTGWMTDIRDIVYVRSEDFDRMATEPIAAEVAEWNARMREESAGYILVGPGRWGSSDPYLGIPVRWAQISEARVVVECSIPGFEVEPSQGTHFFQNVTSLGVGYLTLNPCRGQGRFDQAALDALPAVSEGRFLRHVRFDKPLQVCVDGRAGRALVKIEE